MRTDDQRRAIVDAATDLLLNEGGRALNVRAVMHRAGVSRTAFYRQFDSIHDVLRAMFADLLAELESTTVDWMREPGTVGSPDIVERNMLETARQLAPHAALLCAIQDASGADPEIRRLWRDGVLESRIRATEAAIRRDQAAGVFRASIDPADTARSLILQLEALALEILGRRGGTPEEFARLTAPIWRHVLFTDVTLAERDPPSISVRGSIAP